MNIIRFWNQNRKDIIIIVVFIAFFLILLQVINSYMIKQKNENMVLQNTNLIDVEETNKNTVNVSETSENAISSYEDAIKLFIKYLNNGDTENAYNMLTEECKEEIFPSLEDFIQNYYNNNFASNKSYEIISWSGATYKIDLKENALYTGNTSRTSIQDYITVSRQDGEYKLNINSYVGRKTLKIEAEENNLDIKITEKDTYMSYEIYTFEIKNNNEYTAILDNLENSNTIYLTDENGVDYTAYSYELSKDMITILPLSTKTIKIKFSNSYISDKSFSKITFENVILENNEIVKIVINI